MKHKKRKKYENPKWINEPVSIDNYQGFIYVITNNLTNRKYIGKKFFWHKHTLKPLKGKKRKRHTIKESDWRSYWGSNEELLLDIEDIGISKFERIIIKLCKNKWECAYFEIKEQLEKEVLTKYEYYNNIINVRIKGKKTKPL